MRNHHPSDPYWPTSVIALVAPSATGTINRFPGLGFGRRACYGDPVGEPIYPADRSRLTIGVADAKKVFFVAGGSALNSPPMTAGRLGGACRGGGIFLFALCAAVAATAQSLLLDERFADGDREGQAPSASVDWRWARNGSASATEAVEQGSWKVTPSAGSSFFGLAFFTASGAVVSLAPGDALEACFEVRFSSASTQTGGLRFALLRSGVARLDSDLNSTSAASLRDYRGYGLVTAARSTTLAGGLSLRERTGANDNLFTTNAGGLDVALKSAASPPWWTGTSVLVRLRVERLASGSMRVVARVGETVIEADDATSPLTQFDALAFFSDGNNGAVTAGPLQVTFFPEGEPSAGSRDWAWFRALHFGPDVSAEANPYADPDGDGVVNLIEHALGGDPQSAASAPRVDATLENAGDEHVLAVRYSRAAEDVDYRVLWADELVGGVWSEVEGGATSFDSETGVETCLIPMPAETPRRFARLDVRLRESEAYSRDAGYRGVWFTLNQYSTYGDKYSGGLGTYTAHHSPMAIHAPEAKKTFFTYGGVNLADGDLRLMVSAYDHATGRVPRPVIVHEKDGVDDPHDNASLQLDEEGHLWLFVSGRAKIRPGLVYRGRTPYSIGEWTLFHQDEFAYPQPWWLPGRGFLFLYTRYTDGRELYTRTSRNGTSWGEERKVAGFGGHYQVSEAAGARVAAAFNRHPGGNVDERTDLYFIETHDGGETWTTAAGADLTLPLTAANNPARVHNYSAEGLLVYPMDLTFDPAGRPVILYLTSGDHRPGPAAGARTWRTARWNGEAWDIRAITTSTHNYDTGSLQIDPDGVWRVTGPTEAGPQYWGTGGEIAMWSSGDQGVTWNRVRQLTHASVFNHSYVRRPRAAAADFHSFWADGDADTPSESHLYFTNRAGTGVWRLPYTMSAVEEAPAAVGEPAP